MTIAKAPPKLRQLPDGLINGSKVFEEILAALPQRDLAVIDISSRAERYMYLSAEYLKEFHTRKYRSGEVKATLKDLRENGIKLLDALNLGIGAVVEAYNASMDRDDPTLGDMERITDRFVGVLDRVCIPHDNEIGRKRGEVARIIVRQAAKDFKDITGKEPSRSYKNGFVEFVQKLFAASGVRDNSDNSVREFLKEGAKENPYDFIRKLLEE